MSLYVKGSHMMKASLVIPTYNKLERLKLVIESLKYQTEKKENFEVIIVDDGSTDETAEYFHKLRLPFELRYIYQERKGRAAARNTGIYNANYEIVIFFDDDLILDREFIYNRLQYHKDAEHVVHGRIMDLPKVKFFKDPVRGIFFDNIKLHDPVKKILVKNLVLPEMLQDEALFQANIVSAARMTALEGLIKQLLDKYPGRMDWVSCVGGNLSVAKNILLEAGGFDEGFGLEWGCEDIELGFRLMKRGCRFIYADNSVNYHIAHYRVNAMEEHSKNLKYFYDKYKEPQILLFDDFISQRIKAQQLISKIFREEG